MPEITVSQYEIGMNGSAALNTAITTQITGGAKYLLAVATYQRFGSVFAIAVTSTNVTKSSGQTQIGNTFKIKEFNISSPEGNGVADIATWMNAQYAATPSLVYLHSFEIIVRENQIFVVVSLSN